MTKDEIVSQITSANTEIVFALLSDWVPFLKLPLIAWVVKYYIGKGLKPGINEGVVFVKFKVIDWDKLEKAKNFADALIELQTAIRDGFPDEKDSSDDFDKAFRSAVGIDIG